MAAWIDVNVYGYVIGFDWHKSDGESVMDFKESRELAEKVIKQGTDMYPMLCHLLAKAHLEALDRIDELEKDNLNLKVDVFNLLDKVKELEALLREVLDKLIELTRGHAGWIEKEADKYVREKRKALNKGE